MWWRFGRADGDLWGIAGLWNVWTDKTSGEMHESFTMLTLNADRPGPKRPPNMQDKRSVVSIELADVDTWLYGTQAGAQQLLRLSPVELFDAGPA